MNIIEVKYIEKSKAILRMYPENNSHMLILECEACVGKNGIHKKTEGDFKTPSGWYHFTIAFGIGAPPKTALEYVQINEHHYWCGDAYKYNQLIDITEHPHSCTGEHLIDYPDAYEYAIAIDYNADSTLDAGSAIFFHCTVPGHDFTAGCVAVNRDIMIRLLKLCDSTTKIWIHD